MRRIMAFAYLTIEDNEFDPGPGGPLTADAFTNALSMRLGDLDDLDFQDEGEVERA